MFDLGSVGCQKFSRNPPTGKCDRSMISPVMAMRSLTPDFECRNHGGADGNACRRPILGDGAFREVDMNIVFNN